MLMEKKEQLNEGEMLAQTASAVLDEPITIEVGIIMPTWKDKLLSRLGMKKDKQTFVIRPATLGTMIRISRELISIDLKTFDQNNLLESNYHLIDQHAERLARIVAMAVTNSKQDPSQSLIEFFLHNLTSQELMRCVNIVLKQMDVTNFMYSIISIKGTNVLVATSASAMTAN